MAGKRSWLMTGLWGLATTLLCSGGVARSSDEPVLTVGAETLTQSVLERAVARKPAITTGRGASSDRLREYLEHGLIPELLLAQSAIQQGLLNDSRVRVRRDQALAVALQHSLAEPLESTVADAEVQAYFLEHPSEFQVPGALLIWRIEVDSASAAQDIASSCQGADGPARWKTFAAAHDAKDPDGSVGFVRADGSTDDAQLSVSPALYAAANALADGQLSAEPVADRQRFTVIWRRGSRPGRTAVLGQVATSIRSKLLAARVEVATQALLEKLKQDHLRDFHPELLNEMPSKP